MLTTLLVMASISAIAQSDYPQGYFRNPLNIPIDLSGNFGELRPNHFHMGLDLKTNQRENLPVYASAEGYVSRIKIEPGGFGRAIYITHPNGYTTLYAHLNQFVPRIESYLKQQQYKLQSWRVQLEVPAGLIAVRKGEFIAYSGNTGGSQAPHLHFEIRRTADDVNLNPLLFGLPVKDNTKPRIFGVAIYDRTRSVYEQTPMIAPVKPSLRSSGYITTPTIITVGAPVISLAISAFDTHTGSANLNGIYEARLEVNGEDVQSFRMDQISYNDTRYLNAHIDYRYKALSNKYLQHLSDLPGYINSIYDKGINGGVLDISDGGIYDILIEVSDAEGNTSEVKTAIQYNFTAAVKPPDTSAKMFYPLMLDGYETENCEFYIGERCLYDSVHVKYSNTASGNPDVISDVHTIGDSYIPLQDSMLVRIKPDLTFTEADRNFTVMQWFSGSRSSVQKVEWQGEWAAAKFRDFGHYQLLRDTVPPVIIPLGFKNNDNLASAKRITFTVRDNFLNFYNVRAELDGKWLRFSNDKGRNFIYEFDEKCPRGSHILEISAEDAAGNKSTKEFIFTR